MTEVSEEVGIRKRKGVFSFLVLKTSLDFLKVRFIESYAVKLLIFGYGAQNILTNVFSCVTTTTVEQFSAF